LANQLGAIKHIVLLMLENRSFDQMLGFLYESNGNRSLTNQPYEGLTGNEFNPDDTGREIKVFKIDPQQHTYLMPGADPGEGFHNTNYQLFCSDQPSRDAVPSMKGFVINFKAAIASDIAKHYQDSLPGTVAGDIMGMYPPEALPIMSGLAKGFAVCDQWFASAPTQTIPNRAFVGAATSQGHLDNQVKSFTCPSIFGALSKAGIDWAIYGYNRDPMTRLDFTDTQEADESHFGHFRDFQERAAKGTLPAYTFLEPSWGSDGNSQHPNYDVSLGEQLMHDAYYALRNGPGWDDTLFVITYDEHGGNYDHVPPPWGAATPDGTVGEWGFDFTRFGVRVPAVLISPRIAAGTVFRARRGTIDHTSLLKTIELRWNLDPLTARDKAAPDLGDVLTLAAPRRDDPLAGIAIPPSSGAHPNSAEPSVMEKIHASRVAKLPIRNDKGTYDQHSPPQLTSSSAIGEYIQYRTAAWTQHLERVRRRHGPHATSGTGSGTAKKKKAAPAKRGGARKKKRR
jgi:phospholipase C